MECKASIEALGYTRTLKRYSIHFHVARNWVLQVSHGRTYEDRAIHPRSRQVNAIVKVVSKKGEDTKRLLFHRYST